MVGGHGRLVVVEVVLIPMTGGIVHGLLEAFGGFESTTLPRWGLLISSLNFVAVSTAQKKESIFELLLLI